MFVLGDIVQMCSGEIAVGAEWHVYVSTFRKVCVLSRKCKIVFQNSLYVSNQKLIKSRYVILKSSSFPDFFQYRGKLI